MIFSALTFTHNEFPKNTVRNLHNVTTYFASINNSIMFYRIVIELVLQNGHFTQSLYFGMNNGQIRLQGVTDVISVSIEMATHSRPARRVSIKFCISEQKTTAFPMPFLLLLSSTLIFKWAFDACFPWILLFLLVFWLVLLPLFCLICDFNEYESPIGFERNSSFMEFVLLFILSLIRLVETRIVFDPRCSLYLFY